MVTSLCLKDYLSDLSHCLFILILGLREQEDRGFLANDEGRLHKKDARLHLNVVRLVWDL